MQICGETCLFVGSQYINSDNEEHDGRLNEWGFYDEYWIQEPIEITIQRLRIGLQTLDINLINIEPKHYFYKDGQLSINFICEYNDNIILETEMYIQGIKTFDWQNENDCLLEIFFPTINHIN